MKSKSSIGLVTSTALALAVALSLVGGVHQVSAACGDGAHCWHLVSSYDGINNNSNTLNSVVAISQNNVWAVGSYYNGTKSQTLAERWDGSSWQNGNSVNQGSANNILSGVASAPGDSNVWAVGSYADSTSNIQKTLIEQYSGSPASWSVVTSPNSGSSNNWLNAVAGDSVSDYWAVGSYQDTSGYERTLIERWDGSSWKVVSSPNHSTGSNRLLSVTVIDKTHAWAVGFDNFTSPLLLNWDGTSWTDHTGSLPASSASGLFSVSFLNNQHGFAVGQATGFQYAGLPNPTWSISSPANYSNGVAYITSSSAWAVGYIPGSLYHSTTSYWDGSAWRTVTPAGSGQPNGDQFNAVSGLSQNDTWAVGQAVDVNHYYKTYIEHYY